MNHARLRTTAALLTAVVFAGSLSGCWNPFAPKSGDGGGGEDDFEYKLRTSPENVVYNLMNAYERMDAAKYLECLAEDFIFFLNEEDTAEPDLPDYWGKAEETAIHERMFSDTTDVQSIELTLTQFGGPEEVPGEFPEDPPRYLYKQNVDLWVHLPNEVTLWANAGATFLFDRDPDETGPSGQELWHVVEWQDVEKFGTKLITPREGEVPISISELKAKYLR